MIKIGEEIPIKVEAMTPQHNVGWLYVELPKNVMETLQSYIETAKKNPISFNDKLAGNITKSLELKDKDNWFFHTILNNLCMYHEEKYPAYSKEFRFITHSVPYCLSPFWVNFQKENEFNPPHNHTGIFSFVIFVKIPTDWREQHALPISANSNSPNASNFALTYNTLFGDTTSTPFHLDKEMEGHMLFFPSKLTHSVYPFYNCDEERISISGNILFDTRGE